MCLNLVRIAVAPYRCRKDGSPIRRPGSDRLESDEGQ